MQIQVNTDRTIDATDGLAATVETTVHAALDRYGDRITRVEAHVSDDETHPLIRCLLEARPAGMAPVVVTGTGETAERACHDAAHKMQSLLGSRFGRIDSHDKHATIRHTED